jgi:holo-[acyl-carrier protein] synthase
MILGIGNDLVDIRRIERTLGRFGARFIERVFTRVEREKSEQRKNNSASYAKRFAAKEACAKALGTGFRQGVFWRDLGVINLDSGKPSMVLTGGAAQRLASMTPSGMKAMIELSITDESSLVEAIVIISAIPESAPEDISSGKSVMH